MTREDRMAETLLNVRRDCVAALCDLKALMALPDTTNSATLMERKLQREMIQSRIDEIDAALAA